MTAASIGLFLVTCLCGGLGATMRFIVNTAVNLRWHGRFPLSTMIINLLATFAAGCAFGGFSAGTLPHAWYLLLVTGFLGGFSTFSTAISEMVSLARNGRHTMALAYLCVTIILPTLCVFAGYTLVA